MPQWCIQGVENFEYLVNIQGISCQAMSTTSSLATVSPLSYAVYINLCRVPADPEMQVVQQCVALLLLISIENDVAVSVIERPIILF